jgi:hypothetical protein
MGKPIATIKSGGICFAFPDVCNTPSPSGQVPIPYPNTGQMSDAKPHTSTVKAAGYEIITEESKIDNTIGDQAGSLGAINSTPPNSVGKSVTFATYSGTVRAQGKRVVRMFDSTKQNDGNAVGQVLGGEATILVGD